MTQPPIPPPSGPQGYYIPVKRGPSAGKVLLWVIGIAVAIPVLVVVAILVLLQVT